MKIATEAAVYLPTDTTTLYLGATASGTWVTLSAALAVDLLLLGVYGTSGNAGAIIEVGKGAAGAEIVIARSRVVPSNIVPFGLGVKVTAGARLALRWINTSGSVESLAIQALPLTGVTDF